MPDLQFTIDDRPDRVGTLIAWLLRLAVAVAFCSIGVNKFGAHSGWIGIFDRIGFGQWFRYLTGVLQVTGAALVLIPRTSLAGILLLSCTMVGAMAAWIFRLGAPGNAVIPGVILVVLLGVGFVGLRQD
jgi:putative oxidoreductase